MLLCVLHGVPKPLTVTHLPPNDTSHGQFNGKMHHTLSQNIMSQQSIEHIDEIILITGQRKKNYLYCALSSRLNSHHHTSPIYFESPFTILIMLISQITRMKTGVYQSPELIHSQFRVLKNSQFTFCQE